MRALNQNSQNMLDLDIIKQDGKVSVGEISTDLSKKFNAPKEVIMKDVIEMLQELSDK